MDGLYEKALAGAVSLLASAVSAILAWRAKTLRAGKSRPASSHRDAETLSQSEARLRTELLNVVAGLRDESEEKSRKIAAMQQEAFEYERIVDELERRLKENFDLYETVEAFCEYLPLPAWIKDADSRMQRVNREYERTFGITELAYRGRLDSEIWPPEIAAKFVEHDRRVLNRKAGMEFRESLPNDPSSPVSEHNPLVPWRIFKFPIVVKGAVVGVGGVAVRVTSHA